VEEKIMRWHENYGEEDIRSQAPKKRFPAASGDRPNAAPYAAPARTAPAVKADNSWAEQNGHDAVCSSCGINTKTVFVPDGVRPVYCKECLGKKKEEKRMDAEQRKQAKVEETRRMEETKRVEEAAPALSLGDLKAVKPVDFKGREIKVRNNVEKKPEVKKVEEKDAISEEVEEIFNQFEEKEIKEGEDINL